MISNKTADKTTKVSRSPSQNSSETIESEKENIEHDKEAHKERSITPEKREKVKINKIV